MTTRVFIDGEAGTTGLEIRDRLENRADIALLQLDDTRRKDADARRELLNAAEIAILCLPDDAAREAVAMVETNATRIIDASSAHRVADGWVFGFPEFLPGHRDAIAGAARITNPGCYSTAAIGLLRPLIDEGLIPADHPLTINAVSGYSGGGKGLIARFEDASSADAIDTGGRAYALTLSHKHVPEIVKQAGLERRPVFTPLVARTYKGMIVQIPLHLDTLPGRPDAATLRSALEERYDSAAFVEVASEAETAALDELLIESRNDTNTLKLYVFGNAGTGQAVLTAVLDNLGKGASGQAVQCLNLMTGADESAGLKRSAA